MFEGQECGKTELPSFNGAYAVWDGPEYGA